MKKIKKQQTKHKKPLYEINPKTEEVTFNLYPTQQEFFGPQKYICYSGGLGSGKTAAGVLWVITKILSNPETLGFIGANTYKQLTQSTLKPFFETLHNFGYENGVDYVTDRKPPKDWGIVSPFKKCDGIITFRNGCFVVTRSLDNYNDIRGAEYGWAWIDETRDTPLKAWEVLIGRLRDPKSDNWQIRITTTPPEGYSWLYEIFVEKIEQLNKDEDGNFFEYYKIIYARTEDNINGLPKDYINTLVRSYDKETAQTELYGRFVISKTGNIYKYYEPNIHEEDEIGYEPDLPIGLAFDFNVNPMSVAMVHFFKDEIIVFDEIVMGTSITEDVCMEFRHRYPNHSAGLIIYGDATGRRAGTRSTKNDYNIIEDCLGDYPGFEMRVPVSNPPVRDRISRVNSMLMNVLRETKLYHSKKCEKLKDDFTKLRYKKGTNEIDKDKDLKLSHISDALGYAICYEYPVVYETIDISNDRRIY